MIGEGEGFLFSLLVFIIFVVWIFKLDANEERKKEEAEREGFRYPDPWGIYNDAKMLRKDKMDRREYLLKSQKEREIEALKDLEVQKERLMLGELTEQEEQEFKKEYKKTKEELMEIKKKESFLLLEVESEETLYEERIVEHILRKRLESESEEERKQRRQKEQREKEYNIESLLGKVDRADFGDEERWEAGKKQIRDYEKLLESVRSSLYSPEEAEQRRILDIDRVRE